MNSNSCVLDFAALQRSGYAVGPSVEEEAADAAQKFRQACEATPPDIVV